MAGQEADFANAHATGQKLVDGVSEVIFAKRDAISAIVACWLAGGHVLLEDFPGTGKTVLAKALAKVSGVEFSRIQFTPDLLPSDVLGVSIYHQDHHEFEFKPGPVFTTLLLADEINRATPRTQSALLEAMAEKQVSMDSKTHALPPAFFVLATQNPVELLGTFPLPEAQMDRFAMRLSLGLPSPQQEVAIIQAQNDTHPLERVQQKVRHEELESARQQVKSITVSDDVQNYIVQLAHEIRKDPRIRFTLSPRATIALTKVCQAHAIMCGETYVLPEYVQQLAVTVFAHRLSLTAEARLDGLRPNDLVNEVMSRVRVPVRRQ